MIYRAIWFNMGQYNVDDKVPKELIGFDCPFEDSPVISASDIGELVQAVQLFRVGDHPDFPATVQGGLPDVIIDEKANILPNAYSHVANYDLDTKSMRYSMERESLATLWNREKWRWKE